MSPDQNKTVFIVGAGRQGRNALEILTLRYRIEGFLDNFCKVGEEIDGVPVVGPADWFETGERVRQHDWFVAFGDNRTRMEISDRIGHAGGVLVNAIHPTASVSPNARLGNGLYVGAFCRVGTGARLADGILIEAFTFVGCDVTMGAFARTGPSARLLGAATLGELSLIGSGAVVCEQIDAGSHCIVGANSVVLEPVGPGQNVYGAPARAKGRD